MNNPAHIPTPAMNTDRELWRESEGDYYSPSIHVTARGGIGINVGGTVIVRALRDWHRLAMEAAREPTPSEDVVEKLQEALQKISDYTQGLSASYALLSCRNIARDALASLKETTKDREDNQPTKSGDQNQHRLCDECGYALYECYCQPTKDRETDREALLQLADEFDRWLEKGPNEQPHYPNGMRPFSTGDLKTFVAALRASSASQRG